MGGTFGFDPTKRRIRYAAHIVNLVAMQIMYGKDLKSFEAENADVRHLREDLELWRRKGALGKLRNIIMWITGRYVGGSRLREVKALQTEHQNTLVEEGESPLSLGGRMIRDGIHTTSPSRQHVATELR